MSKGLHCFNMSAHDNSPVLFIAPLTKSHGQGRVSIHALNAINKSFKTEVINTNTFKTGYLIKIFKNIYINFYIIFKIIKLVISEKSFYVYFTPSRNLFSSLRDFTLLLSISLIKLTLRYSNLKVFAHLHGSDLLIFLKKSIYGQFLNKMYVNNISKMIINSEDHKFSALGENYLNYRILNNPIILNEEQIKEIHNCSYYKQGKIICSFISNPIKEKGLMESINWCSLNFKNINWELNVIGWSQEDFKNIYKYDKLKSKNIVSDKKIIFHGHVTEKKKFEILKRSYIFVFLSQKEAQPLALIEAAIFKNLIVISKLETLSEWNNFKTFIQINSDFKTETNIILNGLQNQKALEKTSKDFLIKHSFKRFESDLVNLFIKNT